MATNYILDEFDITLVNRPDPAAIVTSLLADDWTASPPAQTPVDLSGVPAAVFIPQGNAKYRVRAYRPLGFPGGRWSFSDGLDGTLPATYEVAGTPVPVNPPAPSPNAPYDPSTLIGQVRFHAADTDITVDGQGNVVDNAAFSDAELSYCLAQNGQIPMLAAATALDVAAADASKAAVLLKTEATSTDLRTMAAELAARAKTLRETAPFAVAGCGPDPVFTTDACGGLYTGTMDGW